MKYTETNHFRPMLAIALSLVLLSAGAQSATTYEYKVIDI